MRVSVVLSIFLCFARLGKSWPQAQLSPYQEPLGIHQDWSVQEQDNRTCEAGSRTFSGRVNVTDGKSLFFWFVESRQDPEDRPTILWLNGGPGASSMLGFFAEIGPCGIKDDDSHSAFNPDSWANHANLLFLDQPASVGLSTVDDKDLIPGDLGASSSDFSAFLGVFFGSIFPQFASNPLFLAGESHGGRYVPRYAYDFARRQRVSTRRTAPFNLSGTILVDAVVSAKFIATGQYDLFCVEGPSSRYFSFNQTACDAIAAATPECERLFDFCEVARDPQLCRAAEKYCDAEVGKYFTEEYESHRRSPYDLRKDCPDFPLCNSTNPNGGSIENYLNKPEIQKLLGFPTYVNYSNINFELNKNWSDNPLTSLPSTPEVAYLLDTEGMDVLVLNGQYDVAVNTPSTIRFYDSLGWHGQAGYRAQQLEDWFWEDGNGEVKHGGMHKGFGQLQLFTIDDAGHTSPGDQKGAATSALKHWLDGLQTQG